MVRTCTGTKGFDGCGKVKMESEFSLSHKNTCRECAARRKRGQYKKHTYPHQEGTAIYNEYATKAWR